MAIFTNALLLSALLGHFTVDVLNGQRSVLFTFLSVPLDLSIAQLGFFNTIYIVAAALVQPLFGYLTDRVGPRWMMAAGILWMGGFFSAGILVPGITGLVLLVVASLGSGAFHPAGTMQATLIGRELFHGRETSSASFFFLFGQMGLFIGPMLSGVVLQKVGAQGLLWLCALAVPAAVFAFMSGKLIPVAAPAKQDSTSPETPPARLFTWSLLAIALLAAFQAWSQQNMVTFLPKHLELLGKTPAEYGFLTALVHGRFRPWQCHRRQSG